MRRSLIARSRERAGRESGACVIAVVCCVSPELTAGRFFADSSTTRHIVKRRRVLRLGGAGLLGGLAGCFGTSDGSGETPPSTGTPTPASQGAPFEHPGTLDTTFATNGKFPSDGDPADGYPPAFPDPPDAPDVDPTNFESNELNGESVGLVPIEVAVRWYRRAEARFVDARGLDQYEAAHIYGAVLSTAQPESRGGGIEGWDRSDRVITYCGCPHHLSSIRAAGLQKAGFERVYALDEGFVTWGRDRQYPMAGTHWVAETATMQAAWTIDGSVDPDYAGKYAWAIADEQYEVAPIDSAGRFSLDVRFVDVTGRSPITVETPAYSVTAPLRELADGEVSHP